MEIIQCAAYPIFFGQWDQLENQIKEKEYSRIAVVVDENTETHCLPVLREKLNTDVKVIVIPSGERYKNLDTASYIWERMLAMGMDRHGLTLNLGGGVIGDMGGWTASSFMRGMDFIQIPTTLLSMVDASVGGKLGIDFYRVKNMIGLIKDPQAVMIDHEFLKTLPEEELRSGYAEMLKHGLIRDQVYWGKVKDYKVDDADIFSLIHSSVGIKKEVVETDPQERGLRKVLNFGHTLGHAIETLSFNTDKPLLHGEAIAIGMVMEAYMSYQKEMISQESFQEIKAAIVDIYGLQEMYRFPISDIMPLLRKDKKNIRGRIMFSLLNGIGTSEFNIEATEEEINSAVAAYFDR